jgi:hypothetical protein
MERDAQSSQGAAPVLLLKPVNATGRNLPA